MDSNVIEFPQAGADEEVQLEIERTEEFYDTAKVVSAYLKALPLSVEQNDNLIALLTKHVNAAEKSGYLYGFKLGYEFGQHAASEET